MKSNTGFIRNCLAWYGLDPEEENYIRYISWVRCSDERYLLKVIRQECTRLSKQLKRIRVVDTSVEFLPSEVEDLDLKILPEDETDRDLMLILQEEFPVLYNTLFVFNGVREYARHIKIPQSTAQQRINKEKSKMINRMVSWGWVTITNQGGKKVSLKRVK